MFTETVQQKLSIPCTLACYRESEQNDETKPRDLPRPRSNEKTDSGRVNGPINTSLPLNVVGKSPFTKFS